MLIPINRDIKLNYGQLTTILKMLGYKNTGKIDTSLIYEHSKSNSIIALRHTRKNMVVREIIAAAVLRNIVYANVASEKKVRALAEQVSSQTAYFS
jgi:hypothetical protein